MLPVAIAAVAARLRRRGFGRIAIQPLLHVEVIELLGPQQTGQRPALDQPLGRVQFGPLHGIVEGTGLGPALRHQFVKAVKRVGGRRIVRLPQAQADDALLARRHIQRVMAGRFGTRGVRIHRPLFAIDQVTVEGILHVRRGRVQRGIGRAKKAFAIRLVFGKQQRRVVGGHQSITAENRVLGADPPTLPPQARFLDHVIHRPGGIAPTPGVAEPQRGQQMQRRGVGAAIDDPHAQQYVVGRGLGVLNEHVEIAVVVENGTIGDLKFGVVHAAPATLGH